MARMKNKKQKPTGEVALYITRNAAIKKLQIPLSDFRKLCILKGIYPREPKHRQKVQRGSTKIKQLFYRKDILFLMAEPIIWKIREHYALKKKMKGTETKQDFKTVQATKRRKPTYKLDHIVRERYPTFTDAIADLDDALTMCFLFSALAKHRDVRSEIAKYCRKLTIEFLHYVIEAKALRKVFISIKGYYYQVVINGQTITWLVPHNYAPSVPFKGVDLKVMRTFVELYLTMLGFVNYRLFQSLNMHYPPLVSNTNEVIASEKRKKKKRPVKDSLLNKRVEALNRPLVRSYVEGEEEEEEDETLDMNLLDGTDLQKLRMEEENIKRLKNLFKDMKFFIGRENNRESLTFIIRCCGGEISWDRLCFPGATFSEDDQSITHQIVDRPNIEKKHLSRYYIQPQWVYDCINARILLPVQEYFPGVELPAHLSPFVEVSDHAYQPPEMKKLLAMQAGELQTPVYHGDEESESEGDEWEEKKTETVDAKTTKKTEKKKVTEEPMEVEETPEEREENRMNKMETKKGHHHIYDAKKLGESQDKIELRMRKFMIPRKHRRTYNKLLGKEKLAVERNERMTKRREKLEENIKKEKKRVKKAKKENVVN